MTPTSRLLCVILAAALPMLAEAQVCNLEKQSTISAPGNLARPQVVGDISYVAAAGSGIVRIDVSKPAQPAVLGSDDTDGPVRDMVYEFFENILVTAEESAGIGTYSIGSDSTTKIAVTDFGETIVFVDGVHSRFFAGSEQGTLFTVAINGENEPVEYGSVALGGEVLDVVFTSLRAYCALGSDKKIAIVDVSDHANPSLISYLPFGGDVTSLALEGGYLYAGVAGIGVKVLEVSDDSLIKLGTLALSNRPQDIVSFQDRLYITGPSLGLVVADISLAPHLIKFATLTLGGAAALDITGDRAHVGRGGQGYSIINAGDCGSTGFSPVTSVVAASARDVGGSGSASPPRTATSRPPPKPTTPPGARAPTASSYRHSPCRARSASEHRVGCPSCRRTTISAPTSVSSTFGISMSSSPFTCTTRTVSRSAHGRGR